MITGYKIEKLNYCEFRVILHDSKLLSSKEYTVIIKSKLIEEIKKARDLPDSALLERAFSKNGGYIYQNEKKELIYIGGSDPEYSVTIKKDDKGYALKASDLVYYSLGSTLSHHSEEINYLSLPFDFRQSIDNAIIEFEKQAMEEADQFFDERYKKTIKPPFPEFEKQKIYGEMKDQVIPWKVIFKPNPESENYLFKKGLRYRTIFENSKKAGFDIIDKELFFSQLIGPFNNIKRYATKTDYTLNKSISLDDIIYLKGYKGLLLRSKKSLNRRYIDQESNLDISIYIPLAYIGDFNSMFFSCFNPYTNNFLDEVYQYELIAKDGRLKAVKPEMLKKDYVQYKDKFLIKNSEEDYFEGSLYRFIREEMSKVGIREFVEEYFKIYCWVFESDIRLNSQNNKYNKLEYSFFSEILKGYTALIIKNETHKFTSIDIGKSDDSEFGRFGETALALYFEKIFSGTKNLKIEWVNKLDESFKPYDFKIHLFDQEIKIECKSTRDKGNSLVFMTINEIDELLKNPDKYLIARLQLLKTKENHIGVKLNNEFCMNLYRFKDSTLNTIRDNVVEWKEFYGENKIKFDVTEHLESLSSKDFNTQSTHFDIDKYYEQYLPNLVLLASNNIDYLISQLRESSLPQPQKEEKKKDRLPEFKDKLISDKKVYFETIKKDFFSFLKEKYDSVSV